MILDIIFFAFIVAFAVLGFVFGFFKTFVSFFSWTVSLLLSYLLAKAIANAFLTANTAQWLVGKGSLFDKVYGIIPQGLKDISLESIRTQIANGATEEQVREIIKSQSEGLIIFASTIIQNAICKDIYLNSALQNAGQVLALELTYQIYVIIVGVILFVVLRIIIMGVSIIFKGKFEGRGVSGLGRITGAVLGALRGFAYACILLMVISYVSGISTVIKEQTDASQVSVPVTAWVSDATGNLLSGGLEDNEQYHLMIETLGQRISDDDVAK